MNYKAGNRVKIKSIDWYNENKNEHGYVYCGERLFYPVRSKLCGKIFTISKVFPNYYLMSENDYEWTDEMIEGLVEEEIIDIDDFQDDNEIIDVIDEYVHRLKNNECQINLPEGYQFTDENGNVINATKIVLEKKKKEYPKTYEECCKVLNTDDDSIIDISVPLHYNHLLISFTQLLICRDAYWKIVGEEMGLGKPWEPGETKLVYPITRYGTQICIHEEEFGMQRTFEFPTEEMRDAFYENFKELIEQCKELL